MEIDKIYQGDCFKLVDSLDNNSINAVLTSPPYNIIRPNCNDRGYDQYSDGKDNTIYINEMVQLFIELSYKLKSNGTIIWNMNYGTENPTLMNLFVANIIERTPFTLGDIIVWKKLNAMPNNVSKNKLTRNCEFVYIFCKKDEYDTYNAYKKVLGNRDNGQNIYEVVYNFIEAKNNDGVCDLNKATFSVEFCYKLLSLYTKENDVILDPFIGTGTTAVACKMLGLHYIGFELSKAQVEYSNKRISGNLDDIKINGFEQLKLF